MRTRSVLFSPGDQASKLAGALESDADAVVFDLEDGVAPADKATAREVVTDTLADVGDQPRPTIAVRLNSLDAGGREDINALAEAEGRDAIDAYVIPKVTAPGVAKHVRGLFRDRDIGRELWCLIETANAVLNAADIGAVDRVTRVIFGGEDFAADVGAQRTAEGRELLTARQQVVMAAAAADVVAIDGITTELSDLSVVERDAAESRQFGFRGKLAIHPAQIEPINDAFTPAADEVEWAERVLEAAEANERGVFRVDDEMIDAPLIERAHDILTRAGRNRE